MSDNLNIHNPNPETTAVPMREPESAGRHETQYQMRGRRK